MSSHKADPHHSISIVDLDNQPVMVAFDIKHYPIIHQKGSTWIISFDVIGSSPLSFFRFLVPSLELLLAVLVINPEVPKCFLGNNSQSNFMSKVRKVPNMGTLELRRITKLHFSQY